MKKPVTGSDKNDPTKKTVILIGDFSLSGKKLRKKFMENGYDVMWFKKMHTAQIKIRQLSEKPIPFLGVAVIISDHQIEKYKDPRSLLKIPSSCGFKGPLIQIKKGNFEDKPRGIFVFPRRSLDGKDVADYYFEKV